MVIEEETTYRSIWALKRDENKKALDVLMTENSGLYENFCPRDTYVAQYQFNDVESFNLFYGLMRRLMDYRIYVDNVAKVWGNKQLRKLVKPKINLFLKSLQQDSGVVVQNAELPVYNVNFDINRYPSKLNSETIVLAYTQKSDEYGKYLYTLAMKKSEPATINVPYPLENEPEKFGYYFANATIHITAFSPDDNQYDEYKELVENQFKTAYPRQEILDHNRSRLQRFQNYFAKTR